MSAALDISVVIPTYNRVGLLERTIPALMAQEGDGFEYEVIFVSNGANDGTAAVLERAAAQHPEKLRWFEIEPTGAPAAPRNVGIRAARGDAVVIIDDDVLPDPDLVARHAAFHRSHPDRREAAVGIAYIPEALQTDPMSLFHEFSFAIAANELDRLSFVYFWTCNVSIKRRFMLEHGMFDERFGFNEDIECGQRLDRHGMRLYFLPAARGEHHYSGDPSQVAPRGRRIGRWHYITVTAVPSAKLKEYCGVLSTDLPAGVLFRRVVNRAAFRLLDNPLTRGGLRLLGATNGTRSRISDLYYYLIFRRNVVAGYYEARREARAGRLKEAALDSKGSSPSAGRG